METEPYLVRFFTPGRPLENGFRELIGGAREIRTIVTVCKPPSQSNPTVPGEPSVVEPLPHRLPQLARAAFGQRFIGWKRLLLLVGAQGLEPWTR
jgi:hypothetical protein